MVEGMMVLMRKIWDLPSDMTELELRGYASKLLRQVEAGDSVDVTEFSLSQIQTNKLQQNYTRVETRQLAERIVGLVRSSN